MTAFPRPRSARSLGGAPLAGARFAPARARPPTPCFPGHAAMALARWARLLEAAQLSRIHTRRRDGDRRIGDPGPIGRDHDRVEIGEHHLGVIGHELGETQQRVDDGVGRELGGLQRRPGPRPGRRGPSRRPARAAPTATTRPPAGRRWRHRARRRPAGRPARRPCCACVGRARAGSSPARRPRRHLRRARHASRQRSRRRHRRRRGRGQRPPAPIVRDAGGRP